MLSVAGVRTGSASEIAAVVSDWVDFVAVTVSASCFSFSDVPAQKSTSVSQKSRSSSSVSQSSVCSAKFPFS